MKLPLFFVALLATCWLAGVASGQAVSPDPQIDLETPVMLRGEGIPEDTHTIDFDALPRIPSQHVVVSDARPRGGVNQHNYLTFYDGRFWIMWSDGPGIEDRVGQRVKFSTSADGLEWSEPRYLTPPPPHSGVDSPHYNTRSDQGYRYISRGFWLRDGALLALASLDEAAGFFGPDLELHAFAYSKDNDAWEDLGVVYDDTINNFPPKRIADGQWMMSRRSHERHVSFLVGGVDAIDAWDSFPVVSYDNGSLAAEEPCWWALPDGTLAGHFRDNNKSGYLFRAFSTDNGRHWTKPVRTNFPDATSKFFAMRLKDGRYVLASNPNPKQRDPLALALSNDGLVFHAMGYLIGGRRVDYPHMLEREGNLFVAFSGAKSTVEVLKFSLAELNRIFGAPESTAP